MNFEEGISSFESQYAVRICLVRDSSPSLLALSIAALKRCCWFNTLAVLLWSVCVIWRTSADLWRFLQPVVNAFFFRALQQSLQNIAKSTPVPLRSSHWNSCSHLSKNRPCLPGFPRFDAIIKYENSDLVCFGHARVKVQSSKKSKWRIGMQDSRMF